MKNQVQLIGKLGKDPIVRTFGNDKKVANFSVATSDYYYDADGNKQTDTQWHNVVVWNKLATICEDKLAKGKEVIVTGKLTYRNYDDKDGNKKYVTEIVANEVLLMDTKKQSA
ncbi:MAG: single-stranded DNA-binding protein [Chitinophagales bacterium]